MCVALLGVTKGTKAPQFFQSEFQMGASIGVTRPSGT